MAENYRITLSALDLGQLLDGLESRAESWERTADYLRTEEMSEGEFFLIEECSDVEEAEDVAKHYRAIIGKTVKQMKDRDDTRGEKAWSEPDPAAMFAGALSLWSACHDIEAGNGKLNLIECYNGMDQLMREVMRVAGLFEKWACRSVCFEELDDVWPYLMQDRFGAACLETVMAGELAEFTEEDCARVALRLGLPIRWLT